MPLKVVSGFSGGAAHKDPESLFLVSPWLTTFPHQKDSSFRIFSLLVPLKEWFLFMHSAVVGLN